MRTLEQISEEIRTSKVCKLSESCTNPVPGVGNPKADIMFVGEAPGKDEDLQGEPFVGRSGQLLTSMLKEIGIERADVFITNIVKYRPPNNRDPSEEEIEQCWPFLEEQIEVINPKVIVTLGRHSLGRFLPGMTISKVHGQPKRRKSDGRVIFPMYHPAVGLYRASFVPVLQEDMQRLQTVLEKLKSEPEKIHIEEQKLF